METAPINAVAVLAAAVVHFLLGGLWYSPPLFAKPFMAAVGKTPEELQEGSSPLMYARAFLGGLAQVAGLALLLSWMDAGMTAMEGAVVGPVTGLLIHGAADLVNAGFEGRSRTLTWIGIGYTAVALALSGAILVAMN